MTIGTDKGKVEGPKHGVVADRTLQLRDDHGDKAGGGGVFRDKSFRVFFCLSSVASRWIFRSVNQVIKLIFNPFHGQSVFIKQRFKERGKIFFIIIIHYIYQSTNDIETQFAVIKFDRFML